MKSAKCRSCGEPVVWAVWPTSGRPAPFDHEPVPDGNVLLEHRALGEPPNARVVTREERVQLERQHATHDDGPLLLFKSHFATCANADAHRKEVA